MIRRATNGSFAELGKYVEPSNRQLNRMYGDLMIVNTYRTRPPFHRFCRFGHAGLCEASVGKDKG